jgi:hypothetical protein
MVSKAPDALKTVRDFLSSEGNRSRLYRLLANLAASIILLLVAKAFMKRYGQGKRGRHYRLELSIVSTIFRVFLTAVPYGVLVAFG